MLNKLSKTVNDDLNQHVPNKHAVAMWYRMTATYNGSDRAKLVTGALLCTS